MPKKSKPIPYKLNELKNHQNFDIVIPVGPNDKSIIEEQIKYTQKNIIGYRNIYLISYDPSIDIDGCITINENIFPFNIDTIAEYHGKLDRNGWYLQQLLKLGIKFQSDTNWQPKQPEKNSGVPVKKVDEE